MYLSIAHVKFVLLHQSITRVEDFEALLYFSGKVFK